MREAALADEPPQSGTPFDEPWPLASWPDVPTRFVQGCDDRFFPLAFQRRVVRERLGLDLDEVPGGHLVALSRRWSSWTSSRSWHPGAGPIKRKLTLT
jgi:hypothetical protein